MGAAFAATATATATDTGQVALGAVLIFGVLALVMIARSMAADRPRRRRFGIWGGRPLDAATRVPGHRPRSGAERRLRNGRAAIDPEDRLRQVERLHARGHLSDADLRRARDELVRTRR